MLKDSIKNELKDAHYRSGFLESQLANLLKAIEEARVGQTLPKACRADSVRYLRLVETSSREVLDAIEQNRLERKNSVLQ